ncbi:hypothetical protein NDU88_002343 [Pleurodeles waltl]|uniref:Uncharacterized protein n=1 Tax=Pleurodeles waltl TaxID=8319 RepID=A0AAV7UZH7_PLEWA|nr:hypothetical protein NDU88_002343 [Pleurodeles waltl]
MAAGAGRAAAPKSPVAHPRTGPRGPRLFVAAPTRGEPSRKELAAEPRWRPSRTLEKGAPTRPWTRGSDELLPERGWSHVDPIADPRRHKGGSRRSGSRSLGREQVRRRLRRPEVLEPRD